MIERLQTMCIAGLAILWVVTAGYALFQDRALDDMRRDRDEAVRARNAAERTIIVMADENRRALERKTAATEAKGAVRDAAMENDPPISPILREALRGADTVSGVK